MPDHKERIDVVDLGEQLLDHALRAPSEDLKLNGFSQHYLEEMRVLDVFIVDYVLGVLSTNHTGFHLVRIYINSQIEDRTSLGGLETPKILSRFRSYTEACNLDASRVDLSDLRGRFWEMGKAISRFCSDSDLWRPNAMEVAVHSHLFASHCSRLAELLDRYDPIVNFRTGAPRPA